MRLTQEARIRNSGLTKEEPVNKGKATDLKYLERFQKLPLVSNSTYLTNVQESKTPVLGGKFDAYA